MELVSSSRYTTLNSCWTVLIFLERLKSEGSSSAKSGLGLEDEFGTNINGDGQEDIASDIRCPVNCQRNGVIHPPYTLHASTY